MSRAFADACVKRSKNSRFCGVRRAAPAFYQTRSQIDTTSASTTK
jgi:hypothetical protein